MNPNFVSYQDGKKKYLVKFIFTHLRLALIHIIGQQLNIRFLPSLLNIQ